MQPGSGPKRSGERGGQHVGVGRRRGGTSSRRGRASGTSSRSAPLRFGRTTSVRPARWAASTFCLTPPIGSTAPCSVISPVMPTVGLTGWSRSRLTSAVVMVTPADGPSLGTAPAGHVDVEPAAHGVRVDAELGGVRAHVVEGDLRRLLHDVAELAGEGQARLGVVAADGERGRLDEQHVAAVAGDGEAGGHAGQLGALGHVVDDLRPARASRAGARRRASAARAPAAIFGRRLAGQPAELALERAHAGLAGVAADDRQRPCRRRPSARRRRARPAAAGGAAGSGRAMNTFSSSV